MEKRIIINKYYGGFGNQMFQYAFGKNMEQQGKEVIADTSWYSKNISFKRDFCLEKAFPHVLLKRDERRVKMFNKSLSDRGIGTKILNKFVSNTSMVYKEKKELVYDEQAFQTSKEAVSGYWQCHKYVDNVEEVLRKDFIFVSSITKELKGLLVKIENSNAVFLHIRGGDYNSTKKAFKLYGNICTPDYYKNAVYVIRHKVSDPMFFVFTNDRTYAESIFAEEDDIPFISDFISGPYEDWIDLMLMSKCKHAIIANSSFSWWGAWLIENKDKIVVAPRKWINRRQDFDICEPEWIKI